MLAYSSETYLLKTSELQELPTKLVNEIDPRHQTEIILLLDAKQGDSIICNYDKLVKTVTEFVAVRIAYTSYPPIIGVLLNLIKPIKRKFYQRFSSVYTTTLTCLMNNQITRGERNAANAYMWTNKKWQISPEEAHKRYQDLYESIKQHGYDKKTPMFVMLNRKLGVKDQLLQGHHRIGICKELKVEEVAVSFWTAPKSADFFKKFIKRKTL